MAIGSQEWQSRIEKVITGYSTGDIATRNRDSLLTIVTETKEVVTWRDFQSWVGRLRGTWCFRGQSDQSWSLVSSLDRNVRKERTFKSRGTSLTSNEPMNFRLNEDEMLVNFQRGALPHHPVGSLPDNSSRIDWLALMQHHGAPTRFLDWTISPYVGLWFAIEDVSFETNSCLWAIDLEWLQRRASEILQKHDPPYPKGAGFHGVYKYFNEIIFNENNPPVIFHAEPLHVNQRITAQQGRLLCNVNDTEIFAIALLRMLIGNDLKPPRRQVISKVIVRRDQRVEFLRELSRMNVHNASLFPGLDGFAKSLRSSLEIRLEDQLSERKKDFRVHLKKSRRKSNK